MTEEPTADGPLRRTGEPLADAALDRLAELVGASPAEQVRGYDEVHRRLADALTDPTEG